MTLRRHLRIAFVSDAIYPYNKGGKEKRLFEISTRLAKQGHDVHIYTMKWWTGPQTITRDGLQLHAISRLHPMYHHDRRSMSEAIWFGLATFKMLLVPFDVIDVDSMPFFPLFSARVVCWLRRKRLHATWHEVTDLQAWQAYVGRRAGLIAYAIEHTASRLPDDIISNSAQTTSRLKARGVRQPVTTVPLGVDLNTIYSAKPSTDASDVIFVGRLVAHKNVDILIRAIAEARASYPGIHCTIVGSGPEKPKLARLIHQLELEEAVTLRKPIERHEDLYSLMKASKVFVLPSEREGFSLVAIEANAAGLPVITVNHPDNAARELVTNGVNGYVVEPAAHAISQSIIAVLDGRDPLEPGQNIRRYDWDNVTANINTVLTA